MQAGAFYKTSDSISNFKIRVNLWRSSSNVPRISQTTAGASNDLMSHGEDDYTFSWQEKVFSQAEIDKYSIEKDYELPIEAKYHEDVLKIKRNMKAYPRYLFTYVEADVERPSLTAEKPSTSDFVHPIIEEREKLSSQIKAHPGLHTSYSTSRIRPFGEGEFGGTIRHHGRTVEFLPSDEFKSQRSHVQGTYQTMYIMADVTRPKHANNQKNEQALAAEQTSGEDANDETNNDNKENTSPETQQPPITTETILCKIRFDASSGLLVMKPDFTGNREPYDVQATTHSDSFQYQIIHCSPQMTAQDRERDRQTVSLMDAQRANLLRASVGPDFEIPLQDVFRVVAFGEILSAVDFEFDSVYVQYSWDLPQMWSLAPRCPAGGITHRCSRLLIDDHYVANFSSPLDLDAFYQCIPENAQSVMRLPSLLVHVASMDDWNRVRTEGYGYVDIPVQCGVHELEIKCWRPVGNSMFDEMRRFFIGATPEIEDLTYARISSSFKGNRFSKLGFRVQSTGTVKLRLHVMQQVGESGGPSADLLQQLTGRMNVGYVPEGKQPAQGTHRGLQRLSALSIAVQAVLDGYQKAKEKLAAARDGLPSHLRAVLMLQQATEPQQQQQFASVASAVVSSRLTSRLRSAHEKKE